MSLLKKRLFDAALAVSLLGIWPRFIEPFSLKLRKHSITLPNLPLSFKGFKIAQISDLHYSPYLKNSFKEQIAKKISQEKPDLIAFTGDFICNADCYDYHGLEQFLKKFSAPFGCYAIFGNHDYSHYIGVDKTGYYAIKRSGHPVSQILSKTYQKPVSPKGLFDSNLKNLKTNTHLLEVLEKTPFQILHNQIKTLKKNGDEFFIAGLGEYSGQDTLVEKTFNNISSPGMILLHNPDGLDLIKNTPGELVLCGHTHGGQINIPWIKNRFLINEHPERSKGLFKLANKWVNINTGLFSNFPFRFLVPPEITLLELN